ncbi:response regulator transcription factor [Streptomyces lydicamycinicus]|uniref:Putative two-component response regulator n=2 Tax=Streptomyces lydicamycinicus TaxID=1546107 RepID=A0A0P4R2Q4_9ACTN|nr:response regulator transcription factor [Streptomyces lydicamycinicus]USA02008.1 response regulator transcription factor [Streptomyces lydicamycinicus]GAO06917.1 putative two-component response regulator [Streptomyces lydicamycinicus]
MRIVMAEDSSLLREGLVQILTKFGHQVVAAVDNAPSLIAAVREHRPELALVDVRLPPGFKDEGLRAAIALRAEHPGLGVLVLSQYLDADYAAELLETNPSGVGYLLKDRVGDIPEFLGSVQRVADGETVIDTEIIRRLLGRRRGQSSVQSLTPREKEVLALMAEGRSNASIANSLSVSQAAVSKHIGNIFDKLGLPESGADHRRVLAVLAYLRQ